MSNEENAARLELIASVNYATGSTAAPALIVELRELRAYRDAVEHANPSVQALLDSGEAALSEAARVIERFKDDKEEQTLMQVVEAVFLNGERGWKLAYELQSANRWRPIAEAPPLHRVELWWPYWTNHVVTGFIRQDGLWISDCQSSDEPELPGPTHWRPLSDPPEGA
jgi:hypothetical protein